jgi:oligopeptide/dipeptide ABC transporter ATP-binding protein
VLADDIPSPLNPPSGCVFRTRCRLADAACAATIPPAVAVAPGQISYCLKSEMIPA